MHDSTRLYLITGGAGFIGSHLADTLLARGDRVIALDDLSTGRLENIAQLRDRPGFKFVRASVTDEALVDRLISEASVTVHLAAAVGVKLIVQDPVRTIETNVSGTETVLRAAGRYGCPVLIASTSEVYGKGQRVPFQEDDDVVLGATRRNRWSYAASKMVDEFLGLAYHRQLGLPVIIFRLFNTVGPRQTGRYGMVLPRFVQQALAGQELTVYGDGSQTRCFCDVADAVRAIVGLAESPDAPGRVFNVGSTEEVSILHLAHRVLRAAGADETRVRFVRYEQAYEDGFEDMTRRVPDTTRIREAIGWAPQITLDETIARVIEDFRRRGT